VDSNGPSDPASRCARCGSAIPPGARHCGHCGLPVTADAGQRLPDRTQDRPRDTAAGPDGGTDTLRDFLLGLDLVKRYPVMVTPPLIAMGGIFVAAVLFFGSAMGLFAAGGLAGRGPGMVVGAVFGGAVLLLMFAGVALLINLVSSAVVVVMAHDALAARDPSLGAAYGKVMARLGDVVGASLLCALIIGITSLFLIVPGFIAAFFLMFALPAVLLDGAGPIESLSRSARLVRDNVGRVLGLVVGAVIASIITWLASRVLHAVPMIGHLASALLAGMFVAYLTVVAVRVFQTLPRR
jgi:hypothetical protein